MKNVLIYYLYTYAYVLRNPSHRHDPKATILNNSDLAPTNLRRYLIGPMGLIKEKA